MFKPLLDLRNVRVGRAALLVALWLGGGLVRAPRVIAGLFPRPRPGFLPRTTPIASPPPPRRPGSAHPAEETR